MVISFSESCVVSIVSVVDNLDGLIFDDLDIFSHNSPALYRNNRIPELSQVESKLQCLSHPLDQYLILDFDLHNHISD